MLASGLVGTPATFINSDVALDSEPVIGSFTVDGLTFAVTEGSDVELVGVSPDWRQVAGSQEGDGSPVAPILASGPDGLAGDGSTLAIPESITYSDVDYAATSIGAYAFYLSGVTSVELPASIAQVDDRAFRSSDVASVAVADGNPTYSSFDGALYDAAQLSLLLIPEGKQGTVLLPKTAESAAPSVFSHCPLVTQISVEEGSAAFASENGLLYDVSLTTLLRVPAGAADIVIRDGCTTIAAGAMEACASLATITAPASVTSISPDVFTSVPTVSLPATLAVADDPGASTGATEEPSEQASSIPASGSATTQITAMVALSSVDDDLPEASPSSTEVCVLGDSDAGPWLVAGFMVSPNMPTAQLQSAATQAATTLDYYVYGNGGLITVTYNVNTSIVVGSRKERLGYTSGTTYGYLWLYADGSMLIQSSNNGSTIVQETRGKAAHDAGLIFRGWTTNLSAGYQFASKSYTITAAQNNPLFVYAVWYDEFTAYLEDALSGTDPQPVPVTYGKDMPAIDPPIRPGCLFEGYYDDEGSQYYDAEGNGVKPWDKASDATLYAKWKVLSIGFDVNSEPDDEVFEGASIEDVVVSDVIDTSNRVEIADPKRPGYVFQGWVIPNADGTEAIDQDLVYQDETDGKWYVDASKLPDYANDEGRVELTARWTSIISVDVPSAVTFYADVVTQGNESREGAASSAFGQNKVASQSEVDLRIVGLESTAVATEGTTLGADSILKKSASATPSSSTQKLFSLYPTDKALTADDLQDPDAVSTTKPADAVDFALDDILLEKSFAADSYTIPAGDTLNLGYRLNLAETGTELDYDTLATLDEGTSASIANISYTFAAGGDPYCFWTIDDDGSKLTLLDIKADAEAIAAGNAATIAKYTTWMNADHRFYVKWYDQGISELEGGLDQGRCSVYDVRIIGLSHDDKIDGSGKAGITFQMVEVLPQPQQMSTANSYAGNWANSTLRASLNDPDGALRSQMPALLSHSLATVSKRYITGAGTYYTGIGISSDDLFLLSYSEYATEGTYTTGWTQFWGNEDAYFRGEGPQYAFWKLKGVSGQYMVGNSILIKRVGTSTVSYWQRTKFPGDNYYHFWTVQADGRLMTGKDPTTSLYLNPAFCL